MQKYIITIDNQEIEVVTNNIYPKIFGYFEKVTKRTIPRQPNIYRTYGYHPFKEPQNQGKDIIIAYGYPNTAYAENGVAYTASGKKLGNLCDLPNLLHQDLTQFINHVGLD